MQSVDAQLACKRLVPHVAGASSQIATFQQLCFRGNLAYAYNGTSGFVTQFPIGFDCVVSADKFIEVIQRLPGDEVTFSQSGTSLRIKSGRMDLKLLTGPIGSFPDLVPPSFSDFCTAPDIVSAVKTCLSLLSVKASNRFQCVGFCGNAVYSTDGIRATRVKIDGMFANDVVLPLQAAKLLVSAGEPKKLIQWHSCVGAVYDDPVGFWLSTTSAEQFPFRHIADRLDTICRVQEVVFPEEVLETLQRAEIVFEREHGVCVSSIGNAGISIDANSSQSGSVTESVDCSIPAAFSFWINPEYLRQALQLCPIVDIGGQPLYMRSEDKRVEHILACMNGP